nr:MAG TPA: hypothetical protein [Caudoviricetes sp.]
MKTKGWCNRPTAGRKPRCPSAERAGPPTLCSSAKSCAKHCAGTSLKHLRRADHLFLALNIDERSGKPPLLLL